MLKILSLFLIFNFQITKELRDNNPALFTNQRIYHIPPEPLFKNQNHNFDFITDIPKDSVVSATLFFKTDLMEYYREFKLEGLFGLYQFFYDHKIYAGNYLQYYFIIKTKNTIHGIPLNEKGNLIPTNELLIDPVEYFKQQARLNK